MNAAFRRRDTSIADLGPAWLLGKALVRRLVVVVFCRSRLNLHVAEKANLPHAFIGSENTRLYQENKTTTDE